MKPVTFAFFGVVLALTLVSGSRPETASQGDNNGGSERIPRFEFDATWPKPLPKGWITGNIGAVFVDSKDHIWIAQRPGSTTNLSERSGLANEGECCFPAPPVVEFDQVGNLVQAWGPIHEPDGSLLGPQVWTSDHAADWPPSEHGIWVDHKDNVWVGSNAPPSQIVKFTRDGKKFLLRVGKQEAKSSNDTMNLAGTAGIAVDSKANELYVADGYRNRRVVVFDADTGAYKRHWGAYGNKPPDGPQGSDPIEGKYDPKVRSKQFAIAHCVALSKDGFVYVCDRMNDRIQVFRTDGTFVQEVLIAPESRSPGPVQSIAFSPDQRFLYLADGVNKKIRILRRSDMKILGSFGSGGRNGGQLLVVHTIAVDSKGNIYAGETINGNRVQRFKFTGIR